MNSVSQYNIGILVGGQRLPIYQKDGHYFVAGEPGKAYVIAVNNPRGQRIEFVESVDGRNVLKDEAASLSNRGMIVGPYNAWQNAGWRIDDNQVREFIFGNPAESIAAQATGSASGVGVIGIAVFAEKPYRVTYNTSTIYKSSHHQSWSRYDNSSTLRSLSSEARAGDEADLGTGMGAQVQDHVGRTEFERESALPLIRVEIQYRTQGWLEAHGIITAEPQYPSAWPSESTGYDKYVR